MSKRATVIIKDSTVIKTFHPDYKEWFDRELYAYSAVPWACPRLLEVGELTIMTERLPTAVSEPGKRPYIDMLFLLSRLHEEKINHMDVHIGNIVICPNRGPLLIDWEGHRTDVGVLSYDLYGPRESGITKRAEQKGIEMWLKADHPKSVDACWSRNRL